ncbi:hypothetical protein [Nostoc sphaeroides]|uniref:Uncharacterized protein n=1 Tax=Nostoc sphaeroides CCNUC1 TaxID=2653204 RepID=A0A5P8WGD1_9NOSO|nr:hypothetical protein [Nostoc sphaeroides]QFS51582.1 hypothetical protein GXM_09076 [Nostoc sphaeroides CCNUC1]
MKSTDAHACGGWIRHRTSPCSSEETQAIAHQNLPAVWRRY